MKATNKEVWTLNTPLIYPITIGLHIKGIHSHDFMNEKKKFIVSNLNTPPLFFLTMTQVIYKVDAYAHSSYR